MKESAGNISTANISSQEKRVAIFAVLIAILGPFAIDVFIPSLPAVVIGLHSTEDTVQLCMTFFLLGAVLGQLIYGPYSDRFGRRNIILTGIAVTIVGSFCCAVSPSITWLLIARFVQGAGVGVGNALYRALMRDTFDGARMSRIASFLGLAYTLAWAIAPVIGGYIQAIVNWRGNLFLTALFSLVVFWIIWYRLPETNRHMNPDATRWRVLLNNYWLLLNNRSFLANNLCASFVLSGVIAYLTMAPFLLQTTLGLSPVAFGWLMMLLAAGLTVGNLLNANLVIRYGSQRMLTIGIFLMLLGGGVALITGCLNYLNVYCITVPTFIFAMSGGFIYTNAMSGAAQPFPHMAGSNGALYGCIQMICTSLTSLLVAELHEGDQTVLGAILLALGVAVFIIFRIFITTKEKTHEYRKVT